MNDFRRSYYYLALIGLGITVVIEIAATRLLRAPVPNASDLNRILAAEDLLGEVRVQDVLRFVSDAPPVLGIPSLALLDGILLIVAVLEGTQLMRPDEPRGRLHRAGLVLSAGSVLVGAVVLLSVALSHLTAMLPLYDPTSLAAYIGRYGFFDRFGASMMAGVLLAIKAAAAGALLAAHPSFAVHRRLTQIGATSALATLIVTAMHNFVPGLLVSVADVTGCIVTAGLAVIWAGVLEAEALATLPVPPVSTASS